MGCRRRMRSRRLCPADCGDMPSLRAKRVRSTAPRLLSGLAPRTLGRWTIVYICFTIGPINNSLHERSRCLHGGRYAGKLRRVETSRRVRMDRRVARSQRALWVRQGESEGMSMTYELSPDPLWMDSLQEYIQPYWTELLQSDWANAVASRRLALSEMQGWILQLYPF